MQDADEEAAPKRRWVKRASAAASDDIVEDAARVLKTLSPLPIGDMPLASPFARIEEGQCPWIVGREVHEETRLGHLTHTLVRDKGQPVDKLGELVREGANGSRTYRLTEKTSRAFERAIDDEWDSFDYETRLEWMNVAGAYNQQAHAQYGKGTPFRPMTGYEVFCEQWPKVVANQPTSLVLTGDDKCTPTCWNAMTAKMRHLYDEMADDRNAWRFLREHGERETWGYNPYRLPFSRAAVRIQAAVRGHRARAFPRGRVAKTSDGSVHFYRGPRDRERRFRIERADGNVEHFAPSETHRADGRRFYSEWPNGRIDLYDGPDDNRRCVYSIHPDGCRDHYEGDAGKEVRTRRDYPRGYVQIFGVDGDRQFIKEERWPRSGCRRVYHGKFAIGCTETFGPKSEPEWVFCSRREQLDATTRARKAAWGPYEDDERKRAVALGRAVIESLGDLATDELVTQIAIDCGDEEAIKAVCDKLEAERERDGRERKRMSTALYKRVVARMSSVNSCPKNKRLRVGLQVHAAFMDTDAHPNLAGLLRGPPESFDAVFDTLVKQIVTAEKQAQQAERDPPELASRRAHESRPEPAPPPNRPSESTDGAESADQRRLKAERDAEAAAAELVRSEAEERVAAEKKRAEKARKKKEAAQRKAEAGRCAKAAAAAQRREQEAARAAERAATVEAKRAAHARALEARKAAHEREEAAKFSKALAAKEAREAEKTEAVRAAQREALREHQRAAACSDLVARLDLEDAPPPPPPPVVPERGRAVRRAAGRGGRGGRGAGRAAGRAAGRGAPSPEEEDDDKLCVVCMDSKKSHICTPCGHRCLCSQCAACNPPDKCPICRADVASIVFLTRVFD